MTEPQNDGVPAVGQKRTLYIAAAAVLMCLAASALASQDAEPTWWTAAIVAAVGSGGAGAVVTGLLMLRVQRRATNAGADKLEVDALDTSVGTIKSLIDQVGALHQEVTNARVSAQAANRRADELEAEVHQLREQFAAAMHSLSADRIGELEDFAAMWNLPDVNVPVVFTTSVNGGRFDMVNDAFCRVVGRGRKELLGFGWKRFVVDLEETAKEESAAHLRPVWGFSNEWRLPNGGTQAVMWYAAVIKKGRTMAFAFPAKLHDTAVMVPPQSPRLHITER